MSGVIHFEKLELEVLIGIANESAEQVEASARKAVEHAERCGRALLAIKEKLNHGEWSAWLRTNFDYSQEHARRYMTIASNSTRVLNLKDATSIREALRMIADDSETPKRERKPSVEVIDIPSTVPESEPVAAELVVPDDDENDAVDTEVAVTSNKSKSTATVSPASACVRRSMPLDDIKVSLFRMSESKKRRPQLIQVARESVHRMTADDRIEFLASTIVWLEPGEQQRLRNAVQGKQDELDSEAESNAK